MKLYRRRGLYTYTEKINRERVVYLRNERKRNYRAYAHTSPSNGIECRGDYFALFVRLKHTCFKCQNSSY